MKSDEACSGLSMMKNQTSKLKCTRYQLIFLGLLSSILSFMSGCSELIDTTPSYRNDKGVTSAQSAGEQLSGEQLSGEQLSGEQLSGEVPECIPQTELCNQRDDDCDGVVDEDFPNLDTPCEVGFGVCYSAGQFACGETGANLACSATAAPPTTEECDMLDNDCDGVTDEEVAGCCEDGATRVCGVNIGVCTAGSQSCTPDGWSMCDGVAPSAEICDGADNDCDQLIDEGVLNVCGACGVVPDEACDGMDNDCDGRTDEEVTNECGECGVLPTDICDGMDNDCDGRTDEEVTNACGECGVLPTETCDDVDNDCDGRADERLTRDVCSISQGVCRRTGQEVCVRGDFECDVSAGAPSVETCDGLDNDCDGAIDEDTNSNGSLCTELCNGTDEDGDGQVDEGVMNACGGCGVLPDETCDDVDNDCDGSIDEGVLNACGQCGMLPREICDGIDNDCDDQLDEGLINACGQCGRVPAESCDDRDNDCDGGIDEGFSLGATCSVGVGACQRSGVYACNAQGDQACDVTSGVSEDEQCDNVDNDCDGLIDEDFNLAADHLNCGSCGAFCVVRGMCTQGECRCGLNPACPPGRVCENGRCLNGIRR